MTHGNWTGLRHLATTAVSSAPADPVPAGQGPVTMRGLRVTNTQFVTSRHAAPFYEIQMTSTTGTIHRFVTRDEMLYREAVSFEGLDHRVVVGYHVTVRAGTSQRVLVLDRLAFDDDGGTRSR